MTVPATVEILRRARPHLGWLAAAAVAMVGVATATVFAYNLVRPIYDELLGPVAGPDLSAAPGLVAWLDDVTSALRQQLAPLTQPGLGLLLLVVAAVAVKSSAVFVARYAVARFGLAIIRDLRDELFDALMGQSPGWFRDHPTPTLVSRTVADVTLIREALSERFGDVLQDTLTVIVLLVYMWSLEPTLAAVTTVAAPAVMAPVVTLGRQLRRRSRQMQERTGEVATTLDEAVRGLPVVQSLGAEESLAQRARRTTARQMRAELRARALQAANAPLMEVVGATAAMALVAWASARIAAGATSLGTFSAFLVAAYGVYTPLKRLSRFHLAVQQADVAASRVLEMVRAPVAVTDRPGATPLPGLGEGVRFDRVWFAYEAERWVLEDLSFEIRSGETVALVGRSGSGKTTVARLLPRFWDPQRGRVTMAGIDLREVTRASLRRVLGLVTQEPILFGMSIADNLRLARPSASEAELVAAVTAAHAHEFIAALPAGLESQIGEGGAVLSGGQRQRIAIARALLRDPQLLILDEATSALDTESEQLVATALERLMEGRTTLVIAHRLSTVRRADRVVVVDEGRVVESGRHPDLLAAGGRYAALVAAQDLA